MKGIEVGPTTFGASKFKVIFAGTTTPLAANGAANVTAHFADKGTRRNELLQRVTHPVAKDGCVASRGRIPVQEGPGRTRKLYSLSAEAVKDSQGPRSKVANSCSVPRARSAAQQKPHSSGSWCRESLQSRHPLPFAGERRGIWASAGDAALSLTRLGAWRQWPPHVPPRPGAFPAFCSSLLIPARPCHSTTKSGIWGMHSANFLSQRENIIFAANFGAKQYYF